MKEEQARMRLSILQMSQFKAAITPKSKKHAPFICLVKDFDYSDPKGSRVTLTRIPETVFPGQSADALHAEHVMYIKDINQVDRHWDS